MGELAALLHSARLAQADWSQRRLADRVGTITGLRRGLLHATDRIVAELAAATGKVRTEALLSEVYPLLDALRFFATQTTRILADYRVPTDPFSFPGAAACIERKPFGVVGIIAPGNLPFQLAMLPAITALLAGNAVVIKLPESAPGVAALITDLFRALDLPAGLVACLAGDAQLGEQLIDARPDLLFFTGGLATGRKVMAKAAQHPIPVILELGGKDPMLVFADADMPRTVNAAVYGAFANSGQLCVSVERLYAEQSCYERLVAALVTAAASIRQGQDSDADIGVLRSPQQRAVIAAQYADAIARGAQASAPLAADDQPLAPIVLWNVNHSMRIMREESFGPLLPVMPFATESAAITLANDCEYGLNASVWTSDLQKGERVARQLEVGNWAVNDVIKNIGHPALPFGGVKNSGFGRYHGAEGLLSFTYPVSGLINSSGHTREPNWFPYSAARYAQLKGYMDFLYSADPLRERYARNRSALLAFRQYASLDLRQRWENFKLSLPWLRRF